ncbi:MAG: hypothetical protein ACK42D_04515 [Candidatus Paceibacteria bacterium]
MTKKDIKEALFSADTNFFVAETIDGNLVPIRLDELELKGRTAITQTEGECAHIHEKIKTYLAELHFNSTLEKPSLDWETDIVSPLFFSKIIFIHNFIRSLMNQTLNRDYAVISSSSRPLLASVFRKLFNYIIEDGELISAIDRAVFYSLLLGKLVVHVRYVKEITPFGEIKDRVKIEPIHPLELSFTKNKTVIVISKYYTLDDVKLMAKTWDYFKDEMIYGSITADPTKEEEKGAQERPQDIAVVSEVYLRYKTIDGEVVPLKLVFLNKRDLVHIETLKSYDSSLPFVIEDFFAPSISTSIADAIFPLYRDHTKLMRVMINRAYAAQTFMYEVNTETIEGSTQDFIIKPYMIMYKRGQGDTLRPVPLANFDPNIIPVITFLSMEAQNLTGITEFLMGAPSSRSRITAKEVAIKTEQSIQMFNTIISRLEETFIKNLIVKTMAEYIKMLLSRKETRISPQGTPYETYPLYSKLDLTPEEIAEVDGLLGLDVAKQVPLGFHLVKILYEETIVKCSGMTSRLNAQLEVSKLMQLLEFAAQLGFTPFLNIPDIMKTIVQSLGLPSDYVRIPTQEEWQIFLQSQAKARGKSRGQTESSEEGDDEREPTA